MTNKTMVSRMIYTIIISILLHSCTGTKDKKVNELLTKNDSLKNIIDKQKVIIDSISKLLDDKKKEELFLSQAAPLNDKIIEAIALSMTRIANKKGTQIKSRVELKNVYDEAFQVNNYSYAATINKVAKNGFSPIEYSSVAFLILPAQPEDSLPFIYKGQELQDIKEILRMVKNIQ